MYNPYKPQCYQQFIVSQTKCGSIIPKSGLYIENLTGISSEMISHTANSNNSTGADNLEDRTYAAIRKARAILNSYLANDLGYLFRSAGQMQNFCSFSNLYHPASPTQRGLIITKNSRKARFNSFFIDSLCVKSNTTGTHEIQLLDNSQNIVQSISFNLTAGVKTKIPVKWNLAIQYRENYYIVWANSTSTPAKGSCSNCSTAGCCGQSFDYSVSDNVWYQVKGWDGASCQNDAYGISVNAQVKCDLDNLMCDFLGDVKNAVLSLTGAEIADAALSPMRSNSANTNGSEWLIAKRQEWRAEAEIEIKDAAAQKIQQWVQEDSFCIYRNKINAPRIVSGTMPFTAVRDSQVARLQVIDKIQDIFAKPIIDHYNDLPIKYEGKYGTSPMFWGYNLIL